MRFRFPTSLAKQIVIGKPNIKVLCGNHLISGTQREAVGVARA